MQSINTPQVGQRWMVDTDSSLGLGIVTQCDLRSLTIDFPAIEESRCYSRNNAPLTRVTFAVGDTIDTIDNETHTVASVEVVNDLVIYIDIQGEPIPETRLAATVELNHPVKRLLAGQLDKPKWFDLRAQLIQEYHQWLRSDIIGLQGARITLTPHQLYVADTASRLTQVRVLLADEVGLGKTIEAGLILQRLLLQERVQRVLIVVPEALRVQWFVELVRCFNIHAVLFGEDVDLNEARIFITAHDALDDNVTATESPWDMVIVDEAHHFDLVTDNPAGQQLKNIGEHSRHLLLLSATPERMGLEQHFSRLQLLDPSRFYDFNAFQQQYDNYETLADDLAGLLASDSQAPLEQEQLDQLQSLFPQLADSDITDQPSLINLLLDCHGTGRVVFRNTRSAIQGFPERQLSVHSLENDNEAKLQWLATFIKQNVNQKILFITHDKEDVLDIREWLYRKTGVDCPVFHEDMTLVERDRAAAYFADKEEGAPLLLCSEIGSEGRNFQFCSHLICWDLPEHPDVLEQRIGRLDRIGQQNTIHIHTCITDEASQQRLDWYHNILDCIEKTNPAAGPMHDEFYQQYLSDATVIGQQVQEKTQTLLDQLQNGRDRLLEMNSCRQPNAGALVEKVIDFEVDHKPQTILQSASDLLNIHFEALDDSRFSIIPSDQMLVPMVPGIPVEGCELTFDRTTATAREDVQFVTWDHPLMQGLTELITSSELGVSTVALFPNKALKPGMLFFEALFKLTIKHPSAKQASPYLTQSLLRVVASVDSSKNLDSALPRETLTQVIENASKAIRKAVVKDYYQAIQQLADKAQVMANNDMSAVIEASLADLKQHSDNEQARLQQLSQRNALITTEEIELQQQRYAEITDAITHHCKPEVSAVRLLVTYKPTPV